MQIPSTITIKRLSDNHAATVAVIERIPRSVVVAFIEAARRFNNDKPFLSPVWDPFVYHAVLCSIIAHSLTHCIRAQRLGKRWELIYDDCASVILSALLLSKSHQRISVYNVGTDGVDRITFMEGALQNICLCICQVYVLLNFALEEMFAPFQRFEINFCFNSSFTKPENL